MGLLTFPVTATLWVSYPPLDCCGVGYSPGCALLLPHICLQEFLLPHPCPPPLFLATPTRVMVWTPIAPSPDKQFGKFSQKESFHMAGQGDMDSSYGNYSYGQQRSTQSPIQCPTAAFQNESGEWL